MSLHELFFGFTEATLAKHPECFNETSIDRTQCHRIRPMEVLSLGFSRTGTASMQAALQILGIPTFHGFMMYSNISDAEMFIEAYKRKRSGAGESEDLDRGFFDKVLGHLGGVTDVPPIAFARELIEAYPEAKVVLVEREIEAWYKSFEKTIIDTFANPLLPIIARMDPAYFGKLWSIACEGIREGQAGAKTDAEFRANARGMYRRHYAEVREVLRDQPERLLEYQLGEGWEPLCKFLGKEVPEVEFPRINETEMMQEKVMVMIVKGLRRGGARVGGVLVPVVMVGLAVWMWRTLA